jgi:tetratricopeptide (TPR) repeat protein
LLLCVVAGACHNAFCLPQQANAGNKGVFEPLRNIPQANRVAAAFVIYKLQGAIREAAPRTAMASLDQLSALSQSLHDKPLECSVFDLRADYYSVNTGFNSLSLAYYQKAIDFAKANNMLFETGFYLHKMGLYYSTFKNYAGACRYFLLAREIFDQIGLDKVPDISQRLTETGSFYYSLGDFDNAKTALEEALLYAHPHTREKINIINTLGMVYRNTGRFPGAINYFNKTLSLANTIRDTVWVGIATGNIGSVYFLEGKYDKALPFIQTDYDVSMKYNEVQNGVLALLRLIKINIDNKNIDEAARQLKTAQKFLEGTKDDVLESRADYYNLQSQIFEVRGLAAKSIYYFKKYEHDKDSLAKRNNLAAVERVKLRYEIDTHNAQVSKLKTDARIQSIELKAGVAVFVLLVVISFLVYKHQRAQKRGVDEELKSAEMALQYFTENLREKNVLIEDFKTEIERHHARSDDAEASKHLEELLQAHLMTDESWSTFKKLFSKVYPGFFVNLSKKYPFLSANDTRLLTLMKLGLNNAEMANMLGISVDGILKAKQRLRKKLDLSTISDIEFDFSAN